MNTPPKEERVPRDIAIMLRELGFNKRCYYAYDKNNESLCLHNPECFEENLRLWKCRNYGKWHEVILAPLFDEAISFLKKDCNLIFSIQKEEDETWSIRIIDIKTFNKERFSEKGFKTKFDALRKGIEDFKFFSSQMYLERRRISDLKYLYERMLGIDWEGIIHFNFIPDTIANKFRDFYQKEYSAIVNAIREINPEWEPEKLRL